MKLEAEFKDWVEGYGIEHREAGGDPTVLMKLSQEHKMLSPGFFKESLRSFRQWLDNCKLMIINVTVIDSQPFID